MPFTDDDVDDDDDGTWKRVLDKSSSLSLILIDGLILDVSASWTRLRACPGRRLAAGRAAEDAGAGTGREPRAPPIIGIGISDASEKTRRTITILVERPQP
jgi:hypothetical protein